ncbi:Uncharacterised protein [Candidatus Gugararchaeum adminiculabundum]|nr:Uncharacterised protein [Candidatus Gugararchaeum adminiculabundum]
MGFFVCWSTYKTLKTAVKMQNTDLALGEYLQLPDSFFLKEKAWKKLEPLLNGRLTLKATESRETILKAGEDAQLILSIMPKNLGKDRLHHFIAARFEEKALDQLLVKHPGRLAEQRVDYLENAALCVLFAKKYGAPGP